jgi:hypothetical protein
MEIAATDDKGNRITELSAPLTITLPADSVGDVPAYSRDGGATWVAIPRLDSPELPPGQADGYYVNDDGTVSIITSHLTYFGLLNDEVAPVVGAFGAILSADARTLRFVWGATDNVGVSGYLLARDARLVGFQPASSRGVVVPRSDGNYRVAAVDGGGNIGTSQLVSVFGTAVSVDTTAPTRPRLTGEVEGARLHLAWSASRDQTRVTYLVFRNGQFVREVDGLAVTLPREAGRYTVDAIDQVGHRTVSNAIPVSRARRR